MQAGLPLHNEPSGETLLTEMFHETLSLLSRTVGSCRKYSWHSSGSLLRVNQNINTELKVCLKLREDDRREAAGPDDGSDPHTPTQLTQL